jgi:hypothetical protein
VGSGTRSASESPRNRINDIRSLIRNSARSSERLSIAAMTRILNIITGSNGGRPPCEPSVYSEGPWRGRRETSRNLPPPRRPPDGHQARSIASNAPQHRKIQADPASIRLRSLRPQGIRNALTRQFLEASSLKVRGECLAAGPFSRS